jgi:hypothetical protein
MIIKNVYEDGRIICMKGEHYHCLTEPAIVEADGTQEWYCNGELHRIDGPAVTHPDGTTEYWVMGEELTRQKFLRFFVESD